MKKDEFLKALLTLRPYLDQLVIVGGWAAYIYHHYYSSERPEIEPLGTMDIDFAARKPIPVVQDKTIDELLVEAGYEQEMASSYANPPAIKYSLLPDKDFEIEFITNLKGSDTKATLDLQGGIGAQKLRYVDILTENTIWVRIADRLSDGREVNVTVQVPHPGRFVFQKVMASNDARRAKPKADKDIYYAYDLIANYPEMYDSIVSEIVALKSDVPAWYKRFVNTLRRLFGSAEADGPSILLTQRPNTFPSDGIFRQLAYRTMIKFINDAK